MQTYESLYQRMAERSHVGDVAPKISNQMDLLHGQSNTPSPQSSCGKFLKVNAKGSSPSIYRDDKCNCSKVVRWPRECECRQHLKPGGATSLGNGNQRMLPTNLHG
ncbi:MAG: hypothetical protein WBA44_09615 [Mesorhizobium sp.]